MTRGLSPAQLRRNAAAGKGEYEACARLWELAGFKVYRLSQSRASRQTPGLPDLLLLHPRRGLAIAHEVKAGNGKLTPDQEWFRFLWTSCRLLHVQGGSEKVYPILEQLGFARLCQTSPTGYILQPGGSTP